MSISGLSTHGINDQVLQSTSTDYKQKAQSSKQFDKPSPCLATIEQLSLV